MTKLDRQNKRIAEILKNRRLPFVATDTLRCYLDYLKKQLDFPCRVTGIEGQGCFAWESRECYREKGEGRFEKLKVSFADTFELLSFGDDVDEDDGIVVFVRRLSDNKVCALTLADLKATDMKSKNYQLLDDFTTWFIGWR